MRGNFEATKSLPRWAVGLALFAPLIASAHSAAPTPSTFLAAWEWEPAIVIPIMLTGWLYARGLRRCWSHGAVGACRELDGLLQPVGFCHG